MNSNNISRRGFLGASAAVMAGVAGLTATGCSAESSLKAVDKHELPVDPAKDGEWVPAACWHNCGGRCMNKVMIKDGTVVRQKTDDTHEDSIEYPQQRGCVRGKTQQQQCFGADRILHPLKRKGWQPGGGEKSNGQMRGKDEWEVISWDEAIKLASEEIKRISDEYGPTGFYCYYDCDSTIPAALTGFVRGWDTTSYGTYTLDTTLCGLPGNDTSPGDGDTRNDRFDMENADYIVLWASNPTWSAAGTPFNYWMNARDHGAKFVCVDPVYNASAQTLDAEWIPIRPGTDMAFMLAVAYEMIRLDEEKGSIVDWDFLHKYTVGFDAESMPEDKTINENLKDYILGKYDGVPKTPEWAEQICGIAPDQTTSLAKKLSKENKVMLLHNYGFSRCNGAEMVPQMFMALGAMGGHMGKSGHACASSYHANAGNGGARLVAPGKATASKASNPISIGVRQAQIYEVIKNGGGKTQNVCLEYGSFRKPQPVELGAIKCIYHTNDAMLQTSTNQKEGIEAHRAVDFVLTLAQFMTTNARYSDIVLPVTTRWERCGGFGGFDGGAWETNREYLQYYSRVTEPLGEAKSDQEIGTLLLKGIGKDPAVAYPVSEDQHHYELIAGAKVMGDDGKMKTLVTLTAEDIKSLNAEGTPQKGVITLKELKENGGYQFPRKHGDKYGYIGYQKFVEDPDAHPLKSKSGKLEIYCQARYDLMASFGFPGIEQYKPYPTYIVPPTGYESTFKDGKVGGEKGEYPFLMFNPHYLCRSHTVFDNCPWLREAWANPVFLARSDAESLGIEDGDTVLLSSPYGKGLRNAAVMDVLLPGVVGVPHGAWVDVDEETGIDMAGSDNYLIGGDYSGMGVSGYNNQICNVEKYTGAPLGRDCDKPARWSAN